MRAFESISIVVLLAASACQGDKPAPPAASAADEQPSIESAKTVSPHAQPSAHPPETDEPPAADLAPVEAGGLTWDAPAPLVRRAPKSRMRAAEYAVQGATPDSMAELTVYYFGPGQGGSVDANLDRWIGQFRGADGAALDRSAAKIAERKVNGMGVTTLDLTGSFIPSMGPMMQAQPGAAQADYRVLGAIAEGPEGPVFFKFVGPKATLANAEAAFLALVESLRAK